MSTYYHLRTLTPKPLYPSTSLVLSVNEEFTLTFRGHSNHGYNVYGSGANRYGGNEIVGTVTQTGKMEIFKVIYSPPPPSIPYRPPCEKRRRPSGIRTDPRQP